MHGHRVPGLPFCLRCPAPEDSATQKNTKCREETKAWVQETAVSQDKRPRLLSTSPAGGRNHGLGRTQTPHTHSRSLFPSGQGQKRPCVQSELSSPPGHSNHRHMHTHMCIQHQCGIHAAALEAVLMQLYPLTTTKGQGCRARTPTEPQ